MIKGYTDTILNENGVKEEYYVFCQVWKELTQHKTFDSYQFKSFNVVNGVRELIHNINSYLNNLVATTHSISTVVAELLKALSRDYVMSEKFPEIKNRLLSNLGKKRSSNSEFKALYFELCLYEKELKAKYDEELINCLIDAVNNKENKKTISLTSTFISRCVDNGWSTKSLFNKIDLKNGKDLKDFLNKIYNYPDQKYIVFFPFRLKVTPPSGKTKEESTTYIFEQLEKFQISVFDKTQINHNYPQTEIDKFNDKKYMVVSCMAKDFYSASHIAIVSLSNVLNILSFFSAIEPWSINNSKWIVFNTESPFTKSFIPKDVYSTYEYLDSSSIVYNRIEKLINSDSTNSDLYQKLLSSFSYANLSHVSMSVEEKYMNMWIALESLTRTESYDSIIGNILNCVPNACSLRYLYRNIRNFAEDCGRCEISLDFGELKIDLQNSNKETIVSQMLNVIRQEELFSVLNERCKVCSLLSYRCKEIYDLVKDEYALISHIKSHHTTVKWHLDRLYRIRNEIAHSALTQQVSILRFTEHLYDYLATYISEIVRFATVKDNLNFDELSTIINDNYCEFDFIASEKSLKNKKTLLGKLWTFGIMDFI